MRRVARLAAMRLAREWRAEAGRGAADGSPTGLSPRPTKDQGTESNGDGRHVGTPHPEYITHKDVSRRKTMQCQACAITLQIIKSQDLELHYCPRCGAMHEVIGRESCEACRDEEARDRLSRWHRWR